MKKFVLISVLIFALSGCSNAKTPSAQDVAAVYKGDFSTSAKVNFGDNEAEMQIEKKPMSISISLDFPAEISGMGIEVFDEHAMITYEGMEQKIMLDSLPEGTPFLLLDKLFDELSDPEEFTLSIEKEEITARGDDFTAVLSPEDFSLIKAEFPEYRTVFTFSGFEFSFAE